MGFFCSVIIHFLVCVRLRLKCDGTRAETRFRLSAKRTSPFKSVGASVQSTTGSRGVRISGSNTGYTMFRGSVKGTDTLSHSPVLPSLPLPGVTVCHHISTGLYYSEILNSPITEVTRPKGHTVSDCTKCGVVGSNPSREVDGWMDGGFCVRVCLFR
jgi:hypothetical protein